MLFLAAALAGCGPRVSTAPGAGERPGERGNLPTPDFSRPPSVTVNVGLRDDFTLTVSQATVQSGMVRFAVTNDGAMTHGFSVEGQGVEQFVPPGTTLTRDVALTAGTWVLYCPVADHRDRGMHAEIVAQ